MRDYKKSYALYNAKTPPEFNHGYTSPEPGDDIRHKKINSLQSHIRLAITRINSESKIDDDLLVLHNDNHPLIDSSREQRREALEMEKSVEYISSNEALAKEHSDDIAAFNAVMQKGTEGMRQQAWKFRIGEEMALRQSEGWYPFMGTLTVDPKLFPYYGTKDNKPDPANGKTEPLYATIPDMWNKGRALQYHFDALAREVCRQMGHPAFNKKNRLHNRNWYLRRFSVLEHGQSREHHHVHYVAWLRAVPSSWTQDPNRGIRNPKARTHVTCKAACGHNRGEKTRLWPFGRIQIDYFRTVGDIWSTKHGFITPISSKTGEAIRIRPPQEAGGYFVKYLTKDKKEWNHRVKSTRSLGLDSLNEYIDKAPIEEVEVLSWRPPTYQTYMNIQALTRIPLAFVRARAKQQLFYLQYLQGQLDPNKESHLSENVYASMISAVKQGQRPDRKNGQDFYNWLSKFLELPENYNYDIFEDAYYRIGEQFPPNQRARPIIRIGANDIG